MDDTTPCPCRSGDLFAACCGPPLAGRPAPSAAALMRSRYTAFTLGASDYLRRSWHPRTRPARIDLDPARRWLFLEVRRVTGGGPFDRSGTVEFAAHYRDPGGRGELHEVSRFTREDGNWYYVDGDILP